MATLKEEALAYVSAKSKNIAELDRVPVELLMFEASVKTAQGEPFDYKYIELNGEQYRVPNSVLKQLRVFLEELPNLRFFKVKKTGTGLDTEYTVIPLTGS